MINLTPHRNFSVEVWSDWDSIYAWRRCAWHDFNFIHFYAEHQSHGPYLVLALLGFNVRITYWPKHVRDESF